MPSDLKSLKIYQMAVRLEVFIHKVCDAKFPADERFRSVSQLKRSSSSVADNIAESYSKYYYKSRMYHLYIARGECEETRSGVERAELKGFISKVMSEFIVNKYTELIKAINGYITYLNNKSIKEDS